MSAFAREDYVLDNLDEIAQRPFRKSDIVGAKMPGICL